MRSEILSQILKETPPEISDRVKRYGLAIFIERFIKWKEQYGWEFEYRDSRDYSIPELFELWVNLPESDQ